MNTATCNASRAMPRYGSQGQTAVSGPRRINLCVNLCKKLTKNVSDASVFSVSLKRAFLTQISPQIYFHSVPTDKNPIPGIGKYCNTVTVVSAVVFELDTNANFEVKRIPHKRRNSSGFILTATKTDFVSLKVFIFIGISVQIIGISVHLNRNTQVANRNTHHSSAQRLCRIVETLNF